MNERQTAEYREHVEAANRLLSRSEASNNLVRDRDIARAQVHATLALAVATAAKS